MRTGLMGGTFDPVHYGHLVIAEVARVQFHLDRVIWVPAGDPPHKKSYGLTPQEHRFAMVLLATASHPQFEVSRLELELPGPSYTLHTVRRFREELPKDDLYFITGADAILEILTWHRHEDLIQECEFIAATRPGYDLDRLRAVLPEHYLPRVRTVAAPWVDISSTQIRQRLTAGEPIRYLLPEPVEQYLRKHCLYGLEEPGA